MVKRKRPTSAPTAPQKRCKVEGIGQCHTLHPLLNNCYHEVKALKDYLLDALPTTSRVRRKRILSFADECQEHSELLSDSLVGLFEPQTHASLVQRKQQFTHFTQTRRATQPHSATNQRCTLNEVSQKACLCVVLSVLLGHRIRHMVTLQPQSWRSPDTKSHPLPRPRPLSRLYATRGVRISATGYPPAASDCQQEFLDFTLMATTHEPRRRRRRGHL